MVAGVTVGLKAHLGWLQVVAVRPAPVPEPCWCSRLAFGAREDRVLVEPYHVAGGWQGLERVRPPDDPANVVARGRRRQRHALTHAMRGLVRDLQGMGCTVAGAVLLTGRGRLPGTLEGILRSHASVHVAEGDAVRAATRAALERLGVPLAERPEAEVEAVARARLCMDPHADLRRQRPDGANAWGREQRLVALAAWLAGPARR